MALIFVHVILRAETALMPLVDTDGALAHGLDRPDNQHSYNRSKKYQKATAAPSEEGFATLLGQEQGGDGQGGDGKGIGPPGEKKLQPEKDTQLRQEQKKEKHRDIIKDTTEMADGGGEAEPGQQRYRRWGDEDEKRRHQAFGKALVEDEAVEDDSGEYRPEEQSNGEKKPGKFHQAMMHTGNWHQDVADHRNEPCRIEMLDIEGALVHPGGKDIEGEDKVQAAAQAPQCQRQGLSEGQEGNGEKNHADGNGGQEGDFYRMGEFGPNVRGIAADLCAVEGAEKNKQRGGDGQQQRADGHGQREELFGATPGNGKAGHAHDHGKPGYGKELQARGFG